MSTRNKKDAIGQEILAYFEGRDSFEICERDDGWIALSGGAKAYFAEPKDWPGFQKRGLRFARGRVLDVGAGAGRVSLYLQDKGLDVLAIDTSPLAIQVCKKRGVKRARVLSFDQVGGLPDHSIDTV